MNGVPDRLPKLPSALILATGGPDITKKRSSLQQRKAQLEQSQKVLF